MTYVYTTNPTAFPTKTPPMKNPSRERMKTEIVSLRAQASELEQLKVLLERHTRKRTNYAVFCAGGLIDSVHPLPPQHILAEYKKRRDTEQENKRLRRAVVTQIQTVKTMISTLQAQAAWFPLERQPSLATVLNDDNGYRFSVLSDGADRILTQVDQMIQFGSNNQEQPRQFVSTLTSRTVDSQELLMLEGRETTVIPFDLKHCHTAMWQAVTESSWGEYLQAFVHASTTDSVMVRLHSQPVIRGESVDMTASVVVKRVVESDRVTIVWKAVTSLDGDGVVGGDVYLDESGWCVMQRMSEDGEDVKESVVKKVCTQWAPRSFSMYGDHAVGIHPETSAFLNLILAKSMADFCEINEMMENLLIEECLGE